MHFLNYYVDHAMCIALVHCNRYVVFAQILFKDYSEVEFELMISDGVMDDRVLNLVFFLLKKVFVTQ